MSNFYDFLNTFNDLAQRIRDNHDGDLRFSALAVPMLAKEIKTHRLPGDVMKRRAFVFVAPDDTTEIAIISTNGMVPSILCHL